jgi:glutaredoxin
MNSVARRFASLAVVVVLVAGAVHGIGLWQTQRLGRQVADEAKSGDIVMVSSLTCPYCRQARAWFTEHRVAFSECFVETEPACAAAYDALQRPGTPVLVVRGRTQRGFDAGRVAQALKG